MANKKNNNSKNGVVHKYTNLKKFSLAKKFKYFFKLKRSHHSCDYSDSIVVSNKINSVNECYNMLKDNILCLNNGKENNVFQVESSIAHEGKTTMVSNLAVSLSFNDKKVIIVDLDFRRPSVHRVFFQENTNGLIDYLADKITLQESIKKTSYKNVDIINVGRKVYNSSLIFTSEKFKQLISTLKQEYDFVFLDSPPVLPISDYIHISKVADGTLFVCAYAKTKASQVREAINLLRQNNVKVFGTVMTFVDSQDPYSYYYASYGYKYGYGYGEDDNKDNNK